MARFTLIFLMMCIFTNESIASCLPPDDPVLSGISKLVDRDPMLASQMADRFLASKQDLTAEAKGRLRALQAEGFGDGRKQRVRGGFPISGSRSR